MIKDPKELQKRLSKCSRALYNHEESQRFLSYRLQRSIVTRKESSKSPRETYTYTQTYKHTHTHTDTHTHINRYTQTHTYRHIHRQTHAHISYRYKQKILMILMHYHKFLETLFLSAQVQLMLLASEAYAMNQFHLTSYSFAFFQYALQCLSAQPLHF